MTPEAERVTKRHIDIHRLLRRAHDDLHVNFVLRVLHVYGGVQVACPSQNRQALVSAKVDSAQTKRVQLGEAASRPATQELQGTCGILQNTGSCWPILLPC